MMYSVKVEDESSLQVCHGCLSMDRELVALRDDMGLFLTLLGEQNIPYIISNGTKSPDMSVCWECRAHLRRIRSFRNRIQHAQFMLKESIRQLNETPIIPLTTLDIFKKDNYDAILDFEDTLKIPVDEILELNIVKDECIDKAADSVKIEDDLSDFGAFDTAITEPEVKRPKDKKPKRKKVVKDEKCGQKFAKKAKISKNDLDFENLDCYVKKVALNFEDIEQFIRKETSKTAYKKLPYKCSECRCGYKKSIDHKRHINLKHAQPISPHICLECNASVPDLASLECHWLDHSMLLSCSMCEGLFRSHAELFKHIKVLHSYVYTCNVCGLCFCRYSQFSKHYKTLHHRLICDYCNKSLPSKKSMENHIKHAHTTPECRVCGKHYASYRGLERHYRMLHPSVLYGKDSHELAYCVECDKQYASVSKYKVHLATAACHRPPRRVRVPCPACGKIFSRKLYMNNHFKLVHMKVTTFHCAVCNKYFANSYSLRKHQQFVHEKMSLPKNKICDICGRGFSVNRILMNHRRTHTGERPFKCTRCSAAFGQKSALRAHERSQHKTPFANDLYAIVDNAYAVKPE